MLLATLTLMLFLAAAQSYRTGVRLVGNSFDTHLQDMATMLLHQPAIAHTPEQNDSRIVYQRFDRQGQLLDRYGQLPTTPVASLTPGFIDTNFLGQRWRVLVAADDHSWVIVALPLEQHYLLAEQIILKAILPILAAIPLIGLLIWIIVGRGLSPLQHLAQQLRQKKPVDLSAVHLPHTPSELAPVIDSTNQLLQRLQRLLVREQQFSADVAHELRTPISALKLQLFDLAQHPEQLPAQRQNLEAAVERLQHLIEQILSLHRNSPEQLLQENERIDLLRLAQQVIAENYPLLEHRRQTVQLLGEHRHVLGNRFALTTLLKNLLSNANRYAPEASDILVEVMQPTTGVVRLSVVDQGPGIPAEERQKVLNRFYRLPEHRQHTQGSGLGFAIVAQIAEQHQATLTLTDAESGTGLRVNVDFPEASDEH